MFNATKKIVMIENADKHHESKKMEGTKSGTYLFYVCKNLMDIDLNLHNFHYVINQRNISYVQNIYGENRPINELRHVGHILKYVDIKSFDLFQEKFTRSRIFIINKSQEMDLTDKRKNDYIVFQHKLYRVDVNFETQKLCVVEVKDVQPELITALISSNPNEDTKHYIDYITAKRLNPSHVGMFYPGDVLRLSKEEVKKYITENGGHIPQFTAEEYLAINSEPISHAKPDVESDPDEDSESKEDKPPKMLILAEQVFGQINVLCKTMYPESRSDAKYWEKRRKVELFEKALETAKQIYLYVQNHIFSQYPSSSAEKNIEYFYSAEAFDELSIQNQNEAIKIFAKIMVLCKKFSAYYQVIDEYGLEPSILKQFKQALQPIYTQIVLPWYEKYTEWCEGKGFSVKDTIFQEALQSLLLILTQTASTQVPGIIAPKSATFTLPEKDNDKTVDEPNPKPEQDPTLASNENRI